MKYTVLREWRGIGQIELPVVAKWILDNLRSCRIFLLSGLMGGGKTTLVRTYLEILGIEDFEGSPTYNYYNLYPVCGDDAPANLIVHVDMMRVTKDDEEFRLQFEEFQCLDSIVFVENYNPQKGLLFSEYTNIFFEETESHKRTVRIEGKSQ